MTKRRLTAWLKLVALAGALAMLAAPVAAAGAKGRARADRPKLDRALQERSASGAGESRVIVELHPNAPTGLVRGLGGREGRRLKTFPGQVARIGNRNLRGLANNPWVKRVVADRPVSMMMDRTALMIGARAVQTAMGYDGAGVGVAVIDSGVTSWHDDLIGNGIGGQKVMQFVDFVSNQPQPYDDNGHGTHVSGIIAGSGYDSAGARAGVAPAAHLVSLKVLDETGGGYMSDVIAALDWVVENHAAYNIRVVNLSVGASVTESYETDLLTLATRRAVDEGVVVVAAAGNLGRNQLGQTQYGGITAPGNAPWVLTVGASSHMGTLIRTDDIIGGYSSRGPTAIDYLAKPDVVAPGTGIVSLAAPNSLFYTAKPLMLLDGTVPTTYKPYLSLTGTSMSSPVVAGTVALMLQANPALTPNAVKAILQYTAQDYPQYNKLTQGAGFLNAKGAVDLAEFFRHAHAGDLFPKGLGWSRHIIWGNHLLANGMIMPTANAWTTNVVWGASRDAVGDNIVWGSTCPEDSDCENIVWGAGAEDGDNIVWGASCDEFDPDCDNIVWGNSIDTDDDGLDDNIVWGNSADCGELDPECDNIVWGASADCDELDPECDNIVWGNGADEDENIVWGSDCGEEDCENIVWGASADCDELDPECDNIVWGSAEDAENIVWGNGADEDENIVWGSSVGDDEENIVWGVLDDDENIVWGVECDESEPECENIVWGNECDESDPECENIVWGNAADDPDAENIVWGSSCDPADPECDNIVWGSGCDELYPDCDNIVWGNTATVSQIFAGLDPLVTGLFTTRVFNSLFFPYPLVPAVTAPEETTPPEETPPDPTPPPEPTVTTESSSSTEILFDGTVVTTVVTVTTTTDADGTVTVCTVTETTSTAPDATVVVTTLTETTVTAPDGTTTTTSSSTTTGGGI